MQILQFLTRQDKAIEFYPKYNWKPLGLSLILNPLCSVKNYFGSSVENGQKGVEVEMSGPIGTYYSIFRRDGGLL